MQHTQEALRSAINIHYKSQAEFAEACQVDPSRITFVLKRDRAPDKDLLAKFCGGWPIGEKPPAKPVWPDRETGLEIAKAWLLDELIKTGRATDEISITIKGDDAEARSLHEDLRIIAKAAPGDVDLRQMISFFADLVRNQESESKPKKSRQSKVTPFPQNTDVEWFTLPCFGVAAGSPTPSDETEAQFKKDYGKDYIALEVCGDSMEPMIEDGSIVVVKQAKALKNPMPKKGLIYCFVLNDERTLKRYNTRPATQEEIEEGKSYTSPRGGAPRVKVLESINPKYPEIVLTEGDEPQMCGWYNPDDQPVK
ncbi:LexA family transcriptional regulator [Cerasicoccus frondis]|uniref:LexA family transcriptional regulator n=1 Tax=Cerasicoccus frondis TaxID=490090 RepID=UPI0028529E92|nr:XRE family transcriptional regulator [Cerasicoccus frondis]